MLKKSKIFSRLFCIHKWEIISKTYNPPVVAEIECSPYSMERLKPLIYGVTNITQRCKICGKIHIKTVCGEVNEN